MINKDFVLAGRAHFTVSNPQGQRYTYRVSRSRNDNNGIPAYFVGLLTGPDNTSAYTYVGLLNPEMGEVNLTAKSRYTDDTLAVKVIRWALKLVWAGQPLPEGYALHHEGRCGRCHRLLTVPESVERGIGPECWGRMQNEKLCAIKI